MPKINLAIIVLLIFSCIVSCSKENSPVSITNKIQLTIDSLEIFNYSFEENSVGSISGWRFGDSIVNKLISFSSDVPDSGGKWSLKFRADTLAYRHLTYVIKPQKTDLLKMFIVSCYAKSSVTTTSFGTVYMQVWTPVGVENNNGAGIMNMSQWTYVVSSTDTTKSQVDSLVLDITVKGNRNSDIFLFDKIKIVEKTFK